MHRHLVTLGQTPAFVATIMMMFLMGNKRAAIGMSSAASSYNGGKTWKLY